MSEDFSIIFWFKKHGVFIFIKFYLYGYLLLEFLFYVECILSFHDSKNKNLRHYFILILDNEIEKI